MKKMLFLTSLLLTVFSLKTSAQGACCSSISANQAMTLAVAKARENDILKQDRLTYRENGIREEFDYTGKLKSTERSTRIISGKSGQLAGFDLRIGELLQVLATRHEFNFSSQKDEILNDRPVIKIEFRPKSELRDNTTEDKFINRLRGSLLIDAQNYSLWEVTGHIPETDSFDFKAWWIFITIKIIDFNLNFRQIEYQEIMAESAMEVDVKFKVLNSTRSRKYHYQYTDYKIR